MSEPGTDRQALLLVTLAYVWWGCSAIFWRALSSVAPVDQLVFRVTTGLLYLVGYAVFAGSDPFANLRRRSDDAIRVVGGRSRYIWFGVLSAILIAANWGVFLWAIANEQAVEAALGYFLMPIFAVALGVFGLGERLSADQRIAVALATVGMIWMVVIVGTLPWVALSLGSTFALYGWARKVGPWGAVDGLTFEMALVAPLLVIIGGLRLTDGISILGDGRGLTVLLIAATGAVTAIPLLLFASAAKRASLTAVGLLQYVNPTLQFLVGWQLFGEAVSGRRLLGFLWIWAALLFVIRSEVRSDAKATLRGV